MIVMHLQRMCQIEEKKEDLPKKPRERGVRRTMEVLNHNGGGNGNGGGAPG